MTEAQAKKLFKAQLSIFRNFFALQEVNFVIHNQMFTDGCDKFRDVAWSDPNDRSINVCRRVIDYSENTFLGLVRHEIGHLCDIFVDSDLKEQRADDIAELVFGDSIRYSGPHRLQTIGEGLYPRPKELHR